MNVPLNSVIYVLRKLKVPRRTPAQGNQLAFEARPSSFVIRSRITVRDKILDAMGAMLYWAEGHDTSKAQGVDFANCDPLTVKTFVTFLRSRYRLDQTRFRVYLYCHSNQEVASLITHWSNLLNIPKEQFTKPYVRNDYRANGRVMPYGLVHIRYSDKKLLMDLRKLIESHTNTYLRRW